MVKSWIWLWFWSAFAQAVPLPLTGDVSADLPVYEVIDALENYGCAYSTLRSLKPQNHADLRAAVFAEGAEQCQAPEWLLAERQWIFSPTLPAEVWSAALASQEDLSALPGLEATLTPLFPQRLGRPTFNGGTAYTEIRLGVGAGNPERFMLALGVSPAFALALEDYSRLRSNFYLQSGYVKAGYGWAELVVGKQTLEFGDARHGTLLLSQAAEALPHIRLGFRPHLLGKPFTFLGPVSFHLLAGNLGDSRFVNGAKVAGWMLGMRPLKQLELGVLNLNQLGGDGIPSAGIEDYLRMFALLGGDTIDQRRRRSVALYLALRFADRVKLYGQALFDTLGEDPGGLGNELSFLGGLWFPRIGQADLRVEFVQTAPTAYLSSTWGQGWAHRGSPLGHPLGADGLGLYADLGVSAFGLWRPEVNFLLERRGRSGTPEERIGGGGRILRRWGRTALDLRVNFALVKNQDRVVGADNQLVAAYAQVRYAL